MRYTNVPYFSLAEFFLIALLIALLVFWTALLTACAPHVAKFEPAVDVVLVRVEVLLNAPLLTSLVVSLNWLLGTYSPSSPSVS